ncbi:hypothetical protein [Streptomyces armeniacus]|uniref:hypothetical protein n=1 Tax=Streptomyces armeniacus TaxID=83291 RepID=UPI001AD809EA|nr:hypothetical protein [Streptomyces armeniacus]
MTVPPEPPESRERRERPVRAEPPADGRADDGGLNRRVDEWADEVRRHFARLGHTR